MIEISKKINEEFTKSRNLLDVASKANFDKSIELRKEQDKSYKKWLFFKNLDKAMKSDKKEMEK